MSNPDYVEERLYDGEALNNEEIKRVHKIAEQNKDSFMELFRLFFYQLWD
jgi:hypothetical protein